MLSIKKGAITMNRCDSVFITVTVNSSDGIYELQPGDKLIFAAKRKATDRDYAIAPKELNGNTLELTPLDTENLAFGNYIYDIRLVTAKGFSTTIVKPNTLTIEESVVGVGDR